MKLERMTNPTELKEGLTLLLIDESNKIRGIDTITHVTKDFYMYLSYKTTNSSLSTIRFTMNIKELFKYYTVYKVDKDFAMYSDEALHSALLSYDYGELFSYALYNEETGPLIWSLYMKHVHSDIKARINFINLTKENEDLLHILMFTDTIHTANPDNVIALKKALEKLFTTMG